jgi:hypothetical protein
MTTLNLSLVLAGGQVVGAVIGAFFAVVAEMRYVAALRDGKVTTKERRHIVATGRGLRFGMTLVLLSSLGLAALTVAHGSGKDLLLSPSFGALFGVVLLIGAVSWLMAKRPKTFVWGSLVTFSAWWYLVYMTLGALPIRSLMAALALFGAVLLLLSIILHSGRALARRK